MKSTGIIRKVDELGRIVLPLELRRQLQIEERDPLEIYVKKGRIVLEPYRPSCIFCGESGRVTRYKGRTLCADCLDDMAARAEELKDSLPDPDTAE